jgi:hypothetical protein
MTFVDITPDKRAAILRRIRNVQAQIVSAAVAEGLLSPAAAEAERQRLLTAGSPARAAAEVKPL